MQDNKVSDFMSVTMDNIKKIVDVDTIIGKPLYFDGAITVVPISKVTFGFASGGADMPPKPEKALANSFGGGSGAGVTIAPIAFIVLNDGKVELLELNKEASGAEKAVSMVPEMFEKIVGLFKKDKDKDKYNSVE